MGRRKDCCRPPKNRCLQCFMFLVILCLNGADLASDWMLYHDVKDIEQGLVFGPVDTSIVTALLSFSIIGAATFLFELINLALYIFKERPIINVDAASAIVVWFEDVPQITINVIIVSCREEAMSFFQLSKASVVIAGALIRMLIASIRYCRRKRDIEDDDDMQSCTILRCLMLIGSVILVIGSSIVFLFTHAKWTPEGQLVLNPLPESIWKGKFDVDHYFHGAGIYLNYPMNHQTNVNSNDWIHLLDINDLKHSQSQEYVLQIDRDESHTVFSSWNETLKRHTECYKQNPDGSHSLKIFENCTNMQKTLFKNNVMTSITFKFKYIQPHIHLLLGDIIYNGKIMTKDQRKTCKELSALEKSNSIYKLQYFKVKPNVTKKHHMFLHVSGTNRTVASLYDAKRHLVDISDAWKTGFLGCETSGSVWPHLNIGVNMSCDD